jgi:hypothetical protein
MSKVAVLINEPDQQYEGLRSSLGMLLYNTEVQMFVLNQEIAALGLRGDVPGFGFKDFATRASNAEIIKNSGGGSEIRSP